MQLTAEGRKLLWYARRILKLHNEALAAVSRPEITGRVRLGAPDDYAERILPKALTRFFMTYPQVQVDVACEPGNKLLEKLGNDEIDMVIRTSGDVSAGSTTICHEQVVWITSDQHLAHEQDPVPIAVYRKDCIFREWAVKALDNAGKAFRIAYTSANTAGILAAVKAGLAVAPISLSTVPSGVRVIALDEGFPELPKAVVTLIKRQNKSTPAIESLAEHVSESFKELNSY
jgi:DNA-binding transcriptional LysR family regulator